MNEPAALCWISYVQEFVVTKPIGPKLSPYAEMEFVPVGIAVLRTLMDQYKLTISDFQDEIGSKSMASRVLNGQRQLTLNHIKTGCSLWGIACAVH